jgi:hypothetical protein
VIHNISTLELDHVRLSFRNIATKTIPKMLFCSRLNEIWQ